MESKKTTKIGIVGFGSLGQYLVEKILDHPEYNFEIVFIWNRTIDKIKENKKIEEKWILEDLKKFGERKADFVIEVSHPKIVIEYGEIFLLDENIKGFIVGSPTAFADVDTEKNLRKIALEKKKSILVPSGALWGAEDIQKMANLGTLQSLCITMKKHPSSMKLEQPLKAKVENFIHDKESSTKEEIIYEGPVRELSKLAPNNVNTMACAALAAYNLGFDKVIGRLIVDKNLEAHVIEIEVIGVNGFKVSTTRFNPAKPGAVTGNATYASFLSSLLRANSGENGISFL